MAKLKSAPFAGVILLVLWAITFGVTYFIKGGAFTTISIITMVAIMAIILYLFIIWNNS